MLHLRCRPSCGKAGRCGIAWSIRRSSASSGSGARRTRGCRSPIHPARRPPTPRRRARCRSSSSSATPSASRPPSGTTSMPSPRSARSPSARSNEVGDAVFGNDAEANRLGSLAKLVFRTVLQVSDYLQSVSAETRGRTHRRRGDHQAGDAVAAVTAAAPHTTINAEPAELAERDHRHHTSSHAGPALTASHAAASRRPRGKMKTAGTQAHCNRVACVPAVSSSASVGRLRRPRRATRSATAVSAGFAGSAFDRRDCDPAHRAPGSADRFQVAVQIQRPAPVARRSG